MRGCTHVEKLLSGTGIRDVVGLATTSNGREAYRSLEVEDLVRDAIRAASNGSDSRIPFSAHFAQGASVLVKPNWVLHSKPRAGALEAMVTDSSLLCAVVREVARAGAKRIIIGDAPVQGCVFDRVVPPALVKRLRSAAGDVPVQVVDFRLRTLGRNHVLMSVGRTQRALADYVRFDLHAQSLLEPVSEGSARFRVTHYDPWELSRVHAPGRHCYLVCRELFDTDVIVSVPKVKTHAKVGLTAGLKNIVGLNGSKDFLPHHRKGGSADGGDCYEGHAALKQAAEALLDKGNAAIDTVTARGMYLGASALAKVHRLLGGDANLSGSWWGNDTCWRMVLDLNRIALYGNGDGSMSNEPRRKIITVADAIVCGEGDGPLNPRGLEVGAVLCSSSSFAIDVISASLMRFDVDRLPCVANAVAGFEWPIARSRNVVAVTTQGQDLSPSEVATRFGRDAVAAPGWEGHVEWDAMRQAG